MANTPGRFSQHDEQKFIWKAVIHEKYFIYNVFNSTAFFGDKKNIISNNCILGLDQNKIFAISICKNLQWIFCQDFEQKFWCTFAFACYITNLYRLIL